MGRRKATSGPEQQREAAGSKHEGDKHIYRKDKGVLGKSSVQGEKRKI